MTLDRERSRRFWNRQVADATYETDFGPGTLLRDRRLALARKATEELRFGKLVQLRPEWTVLDVGCGTGRWALYFAARVHRVVATDLSEGMVARARALAEAAGVTNVDFEVRAAEDLADLPRAGLVHAGGLLQYLPDDGVVAFARAAAERLEPDGLLVSRDSVGRRRVELTGDYPVVYRTEEEYVRLLGAAGFEVERRCRACFVPEILPKLMRVLPLSGRALRAAIELDGRALRLWPVPHLVRLYHLVTGRGSGLVLDHRFAVWRPRTD